MATDIVQDITFPPQSSIKLIKYSKGYGWEIKRYSDDLDAAFNEVVKMNEQMRKHFGSTEGE